MTTTVMLACLMLGQATGSPSRPASIPVPTSAPMRQAEPPAALGNLYGQPTPADPMDAPLYLDPSSDDATPLPDREFDSSLSPTNQPTLTQPIQQVSAVAPTTVAVSSTARLVDEAFPSDRQATSDDQQLRLAQVVAAAAGDHAQRMAAIRTYWEASTLWADWQYAHEESELLSQLPIAGDGAAQAKLQAARANAQARVIEAQMAVTSAQWALAEIVPTGSSQPPLPVDRPLVGSYTTQFETLFGGRPAPPSVRRIHGILPIRHQLLEARAAAVEASRNSLGMQMSIGGDERARLAQTLAALDELRGQRGAFLGAVRDYNLEIAEYALAVARPNDPPEKIVAMLIEVKQPAPIAQLAQQPSRSVLVSPRGNVAPASVLAPPVPPVFSAPGQVSIQAQGPAPLVPNAPLIGTPIAAPPEPARPATSRVLVEGLRDVTEQAPAEQARPRSIFSNPADATPALPPLRP